MNPVVLVTGASGFVGRSVVHALSKSNFGVRMAVRREGYADYDVAIVGDIGPDTHWEDTLAGVSMLVHLAARVHVMHDITADPLTEFRKVNVLGTGRLAREAARAGVRRFIYVSSVKVNGESTDVRSCSFTEENVPNPQDPYGVSKWEAEQTLHYISKETGLEVVIVRPPLVYGPGVRANFLRLIEFVQSGIPLPLASVKNRRSVIYVDNLVSAIVACVQHPAAAGQTFMVSDEDDVSTPELIYRIAYALERPARLFPFPSELLRLAGRLTGRSETVDRLLGSLVIDTSKIRRELDWKPPYPMEQGLQKTAEWFKKDKV